MSAYAPPIPNMDGSYYCFPFKFVLEGRYELISVLGSGSFGVVYKARDWRPTSLLDPPFRAIKIISKVNCDRNQLHAMYKEIELQSLVSGHPNIVGLVDAFEDPNYGYLILELHSGGDLAYHITTMRTYVENDELLRRAFLQLVDAVDTCHQMNIFHRDLKPNNILCSEDGSELFLSDFGLATDSSITEGSGCGTQPYRSPEVVGRMTKASSYCSRLADIWALGVILINMISGRHPWVAATPEDVYFGRWLVDPNYLIHRLPISSEANHILQRIFQVEPLNRISLPELRQEIENINTFFLSRDELESASGLVQEVAAGLFRGYQPRLRLPPIQPPQPVAPPEARDITSRTEMDPRTPVMNRLSPDVDIRTKGHRCSFSTCDHTAFSEVTTSRPAQGQESVVQVELESDIGAVNFVKQQQHWPERAVRTPVYG